MTTVLGAGRVQVDFWDPEGGYYLNGTYYGDKNLLAIGAAGSGAGQRQDGLQRRLPARAEAAGRRRVSRSRASTPTTTGSAATTRRYGTERRRLRARRAISSRSRSGMRQVRGPRQVRARRSSRDGMTPLDVDYDQKTTRSQLQLRHQAVQRARDVLLQEHALQRRAHRLQAVRRRPADPDVTPRSSLTSFTSQGVNHET